jgi:hypothetical protein
MCPAKLPGHHYVRGSVPNYVSKALRLRFEASKAAAPYCHPRLQAVTLGGDPENPIMVDNMSELEAVRRLAFLLTKGAADAA